MKRGLQGKLVVQGSSPETFKSFVPRPLPPAPAIEFQTDLLDLMERANLALGRLDGLARLLPDLQLFLYFYVRKEAVLSSQIEGSQSSLSELLLFESKQLGGAPTDDVVEVSNYVSALQFGLKKLKQDFPISIRLIKEMHGVLLLKGRGQTRGPGEFRASQNWIGGSRPGNAVYVPPPRDEVVTLMGQIESFYHEHKSLPVLVKTALIHVQFETIHPFLDGNRRAGAIVDHVNVGRGRRTGGAFAISVLVFQTTSEPNIMTCCNRVRIEGNWEEWLDFILYGRSSRRHNRQSATSHDVLRLFNEITPGLRG